MTDPNRRSARVVIMDDITWSDPKPRGRRDADLTPPEWVQQDDPVNLQLNSDLAEVVSRWEREMQAEPTEPEFTAQPGNDQVWGPRPKLMPAEPGGRRTIVITGQGAERHLVPRTRPRNHLSLHARGFAADRTAMWAVLLCVILALVALTSH